MFRLFIVIALVIVASNVLFTAANSINSIKVDRHEKIEKAVETKTNTQNEWNF